MSDYQETEEEYNSRRRSLNYFKSKFYDGKVSEYEYMSALDNNYDILSSQEMDELKAWEIETEKKSKVAEQKAKIKKELKEKEREQTINTILLIAVGILGIVIWIWSNSQK